MPEFTMTPVQSSQLAAVGYDEASLTLRVSFLAKGTTKASVYDYFGVRPEHHTALLAADSIGSHFGKHVRGKFNYKKVEAAMPADAVDVREAALIIYRGLQALDELGNLSKSLRDHDSFTVCRSQLVEGLAKLGRPPVELAKVAA